jgi:peptidoglycan/LPS O-acetylase OafA/YrhL
MTDAVAIGAPKRTIEGRLERANVMADSIRSVAAVLVVAGHLRTLFFQDYAGQDSTAVRVFYFLTSLGHEAVLVFFVLSGYWVGGSILRGHAQGSFSWATFATARLSRLWIVIVPALLFTCVMDAVTRRVSTHNSPIATPEAYHDVIPPSIQDASTLFVGIQNVVFLQELHAPTFGTNTPLWSLAYEFWYYLIFAAAVGAARRNLTLGSRAAALALVSVCIIVAGREIALLSLYWLLGAAVAYLTGKLPPDRNLRASTLWRCLGSLILFAGLVISKNELSVGGRVAIGVATGILIYVSPRTYPVQTLGLISKAIVTLASFSFSLYAIHLPVAVLLATIVGPDANRRWIPSWGSTISFLMLIISILFVAYVFSRLTECHTAAIRRRVDVTLSQVRCARRTAA